jgi:hypothetical protein
MRDSGGTTGSGKRIGSNRSGNRLIVFIFCLGIAVVIWFLIALSNESQTTFNLPVIYENNPGNYVLTGKPDSILAITVSSGGLDLITLKYLITKNPVRIDLTNARLRKEGDFFWTSLPTSSITNQIIDKLKLTYDHISVAPEFLNLKFEPLTGRKVKVIPRLELAFEKQFMLSDSLKVIPDSVTILGQKEVVDRIISVETQPKEVIDINTSQKVSVQLAIPENSAGIRFVPETVEVMIGVDKYTESTVEVPVMCTNPDVKIKTFPATVRVVFNVGLNDFSRVNPGLFKAQVMYPPPLPAARLTVDIAFRPSFIQIIRLEPESVEYLLLK